MGEALVTGLRHGGWTADEVVLAVRRPERRDELTAASGCVVHLDPVEALPGADVVVLAVKPKDMDTLTRAIGPSIGSSQVLLSVAAGVSTEQIEHVIGEVPVVRAMPNTPALVGEGVTGIAAGRWADEAAIGSARTVLSAVGDVSVMDETLLDAVTAVSGTGPAYVFLLAEALTEAAIREGLPRHLAEAFVHQTVRGAGHLLTDTGRKPFELRSQVTSPGGTTAAAVHVLEERGFRAIVEDAVRAAAERARQLGEQP